MRGISDLERGARTFPRLETVRMLADALELGERDRAILLAAARPELESTLPPDAPPPERPERGVAPRPLPIPPTKLVGRDEEIRHIVDIFRGGETRLITLTGQGGIGKSRLGLAIARGFSRELGGRVAYLELAPVRDPALVPGAIAAQLDVPIEPGTAPAQAIAQAIGQEPMLIVTDNWEHVIDAAPVLSVLLGHCEGLWILATSRERLRLRGEWELRLDPLPVPDDTHALDLIGESPAVRLFVQRANEAVDGFTLDETNAVTVLEICRKLDGIPLAIELAAARIRLFPPEQLLGRLEGRFQLLTEGPRDLPERLQTMHAAIAWSVDLLDEDERQLFARLAVFEGGFTIPTAIGVLSQIDPASDRIVVEERVVSLIEKSLVRPVDTNRDEPRFVMYETIRDFAAEQLGASDDRINLTNAHAGHFIAVAEDAEAGLMSPDPMPTFELLEIDIGNFRSAMAYLRDRGDAQDALRIASALAWFWTEPRFLSEGQQWLSSLLDASAARDMPGAQRVRAIIAAGDLAIWQGELDEAAALHEEALELLRDLDDERQLAVVLRSLANVALERNEFSRADQLLSESRELARTTGNSWEVAASANLLGLSQTMQGAPDWAIERHREAVDIWRELGDSGRVFDALAGLGWAQLLAGRYAESAQSYLEALPLAIESDDILQIEWCIRAAAGLAAARGSEFERATRLFSASEAMREATGIALRVGIGEALDQLMDTVRNQLGRERFTRGWAAGQRMSREQALDEARLVFEKAQAH